MPFLSPKRTLPVGVLTALALTVAACSGGGHHRAAAGHPGRSSAHPPPTSSSTPTTTTSSPAGSSAAACGEGALHLAVQGPTGAAGTIVYTLALTNAGTSACTVDGTPQVVMTGSGGGQVGPALSPQPGTTASPVTLAPGQSAAATVALDDPDVYACPSATATGVRVTPPGLSTALAGALPRSTGVCTSASPGATAQAVPGTVTPLTAAPAS